MNFTVAWALALPVTWTFHFSYTTPTKTDYATPENITTIALVHESPRIFW